MHRSLHVWAKEERHAAGSQLVRIDVRIRIQEATEWRRKNGEQNDIIWEYMRLLILHRQFELRRCPKDEAIREQTYGCPRGVANVDLAIITLWTIRQHSMQSSSCCPGFNSTEEGLARQLGVKAGLFWLISPCITGIPLQEGVWRSRKMQSQMFS